MLSSLSACRQSCAESLLRLCEFYSVGDGRTVPKPRERHEATPGESACWGLQFGYDIWANLLSAAVTKCTAPALSLTVNTSNRITNGGFTYDAAGNLTIQGACGPVLTYRYDAENRMTTTAGVTYTYDGDGRRVQKSNGKLYWYGMSALDALLETDLADNTPTEFVLFNGKRIARRDAAGTISYFFSDHLGSSRIVTNATVTIVEDSDFYPFGGERVVVDALNNQYKFTGKERDAESGLDFFIARYYSSQHGRFFSPDVFTGGPVDAFTSSDPLPPGPLPYADITNPQSLNKFAYALDAPLRYVDLDGHQNHKSDKRPDVSTRDRVIMAASGVANIGIGAVKIGLAIANPTTAVGGTLLAGYGAAGATTNMVAGTFQIIGAISKDPKKADDAATALAVGSSAAGLTALAATGDLETAGKVAAVEGLVTAGATRTLLQSVENVVEGALNFFGLVGPTEPKANSGTAAPNPPKKEDPKKKTDSYGTSIE